MEGSLSSQQNKDTYTFNMIILKLQTPAPHPRVLEPLLISFRVDMY